MTATTQTTAAPAATVAAADFDFFQGSLSVSRTRPQITLRRGGILVLTRATVDMLGEDVTAVQLAYNAKTGAVGIRAADENAAGCYRLRSPKTGASKMIGGKRFFKFHGLSTNVAKTFTTADFGNGIVGFILEPTTAAAEPAPVAETAAPMAEPTTVEPKQTTRRKGNAAA